MTLEEFFGEIFDEPENGKKTPVKTVYEIPAAPTVEGYIPDSVNAALDASYLRSNWGNMLSQLFYLVCHAGDIEEDLQGQLKDVQDELCDISHYLEIFAETPEQTKEASALMQKCLQCRREIKNALLALDIISRVLLTEDNARRIQSCKARVENLDHQHYQPRKLPQLFLDTSCAS